MEIGQRIKMLRENKQMTQIDLSKVLKINNSTLSQYETGTRIPSDDMKIAIADYFSVSLDYLLGRTDFKKEPTPVAEGGLTAEQADLVSLYDAAPPALRAAALAVLKSAEEQNTPLGGVAVDE